VSRTVCQTTQIQKLKYQLKATKVKGKRQKYKKTKNQRITLNETIKIKQKHKKNKNQRIKTEITKN
jgi:hypothetical protein